MSYYEHQARKRLTSIHDVHTEIDLLKTRLNETTDAATVRDCENKLCVCERLMEDLTQLPLFACEVAA